MKFYLTKTSDENFRKNIKVNSLKELIDIIEENRKVVIISNKITGEPYFTIEIYDDYRE